MASRRGQQAEPNSREPGMLKSRYFISDPAIREELWNGVAADPTTGVAIVTLEAFNVYCNDAMARIHHGPTSHGKHYTGIKWHGVYPAQWIEERLNVLQRVERTGKPVLLRSIWEGRQQVSYIRQMTGGKAGHFLVITRHVTSRGMSDLIERLEADLVESEVASLGPLEDLTGRELEVLALIGQGLAMKEIASVLSLSVKTVEKHREAIGRKLGAKDRVALAELAFEAGLTRADASRVRMKHGK